MCDGMIYEPTPIPGFVEHKTKITIRTLGLTKQIVRVRTKQNGDL